MTSLGMVLLERDPLPGDGGLRPFRTLTRTFQRSAKRQRGKGEDVNFGGDSSWKQRRFPFFSGHGRGWGGGGSLPAETGRKDPIY